MAMNEVAVWLVPLDDSASGVAASLGLELPPGDPAEWTGADDHEWAPGLHDATHRLRRATSRLALRLLVSEHLGRHPAEVTFAREPCLRCGGPHGRPVAAGPTDLRFSLSRSGDHALVALRRGRDVGVDLERQTSGGGALLPDAVRDWVRKEALLKSTGHGLLVDPAEFSIEPRGALRWRANPPVDRGPTPPRPTSPRRISPRGFSPRRTSPPRPPRPVTLPGRDLALPAGLVGAVAGPGLGRVRVHLPSTRRS
jgi:4'-phosphopantetheinyl transferase